ncbi:DUF5677 domain-containing protein [Pseudomonas sp. NFPP28]|uniref:DUF5677 domain-containing protein n=1 Tax=Pseudomonas sp. NFPP28 TaxID=1566231 RepID=UPI0008E874C4|nr:DUF5677 domain-containing protein [Pseudomonas sp. NFPP28]SFP27805.1 hypothetical protein SAMN03159315_02578 [Pseudomonas sp. NFPP28]
MKVAQLLIVADQILQDIGALIRQSRPPTGGVGRLQVSLILTISEQYEAVLRLAKAQMITHSTSHARSMIEALVAMKMLEIDKSYVEKMRYENLRGEKRVYEGLFSDPNAPANVRLQLEGRYNACKAELGVLHEAGYRPKRISDDFGAAKLWDFVGPYSMLCAFSHNDLSVLAHRHQGDTGMIFKKENSAGIVLAVVSSSVHVVMQATEQFGKIAKFTNGDFPEIFERMNMKWCAILNAELESQD